MPSIVMFSKAPEPGKVKTRLATHMSDIEAASFHEAFVLDTLDTLAVIEDAKIYIACHPDKEHLFFKEIEESFDIKIFNQRGDDLGERMKNAFHYLRKMGHKEILVIGSDSPTLPAEILNEAFDSLKKDELVVGPSLDGGYYLIGISGKIPDLFAGIEWGTDKVFDETLKRAKESNLNFALLPFWYDIDTINELRFLSIHLNDLDNSKYVRTRLMIKNLIGKSDIPLQRGRI